MGSGEWRWGCRGGFAVPFYSVQDCRLPWVSNFCNLLHTKNSLKIRSTTPDHRKKKESVEKLRTKLPGVEFTQNLETENFMNASF